MSEIKKPAFPNPSTASVASSLKSLEKAVQTNKSADGSVNVKALEQSISDTTVERGVDSIKDAYRRTEMRQVRDGCSGTLVTREVRVAPKTLDAGEVNSVLAAITAAKSKVGGLDTNHDGKIQGWEAKGAAALSGLSGKLAEGALSGTLTGYRLELRAWNEALNEIADSVDGRKSFDNSLKNVAEHHADSAEGAEAITWAYRDLATQGKSADIWDLRETLEDAETSFLRYIPFFGRNVKKKQGHLSDREVCRLLGAEDLGKFVEAKKASVASRVGGDFETQYLGGKDFQAVSQLNDPDFRRVTSGC